MCGLTKDEQRKEIRRKLSNMPVELRKQKSDLICNDVIESGLLNDRQNIMLYNALPNEVNTDKLVTYLIKNGKKVYLPRMTELSLEPVEYSNQFNIAAYGIKEPVGAKSEVDLDCIIVPVLGVDKRKRRLGKGKGYYDRFLEDKNCLLIALAFEEQSVEYIVTEEHDITMDVIFVR